MKKIIIPLLILILYLGYYFVLYSSRNISNDSYDFAIEKMRSDREDIFNIGNDIKEISSISNLEEFKEFILADSQMAGYRFSQKRNRYKNLEFIFDSLKNLKAIYPNYQLGYSTLDEDSSSNYSPINTYLFSQSDYNIEYNDLAWLFCIVILGLMLLFNFTNYYFKKNIVYITKCMIILVFILLINTFQLSLGYRYFVLDQANWLIAAGTYSKITLFKLLGIASHFQSIISDVNIITLIVLIICFSIYIRENNKTV